MPRTTTNSLLNGCKKRLLDVNFTKAKTFYWSPKSKTVYYDISVLNSEIGQWALLHESAHALLGHSTYRSDAELLALEVSAWQEAEQLGLELGRKIDPEHVQDCLDTYRDWLYARSTCPTCALNSLQVDETTYQCLNCLARWSVSPSRFCRPYRMQDRHKKTPPEVNQVFI